MADADEDEPSSVTATFLNLRRKLEREERPAGLPCAVVGFMAGDEAWVVDLREGLSAEAAVRRGDPDAAPDVRVTMSAVDFQLMLGGKLSAFKALTQKRLVVSGDMRLLRSLGWLWEQPADSGSSPPEQGAVRIRVTATKADGDHGVYRIQVEEGAACWGVWRRWRELKEMTTALAADYGRGTPFNLPLPSLPRSVRPSTNAKLLRQRQQQMEAHLSCILTLITCSPRTGSGPKPLLHFLGSSAHGNLSLPTGPLEGAAGDADESCCSGSLPVCPTASADDPGEDGVPPGGTPTAPSLVRATSSSAATKAGAAKGAPARSGGAKVVIKPPAARLPDGQSTAPATGGGAIAVDGPAALGGVPIAQLRLQSQIDLQARQIGRMATQMRAALVLAGLALLVASCALLCTHRSPASPQVRRPGTRAGTVPGDVEPARASSNCANPVPGRATHEQAEPPTTPFDTDATVSEVFASPTAAAPTHPSGVASDVGVAPMPARGAILLPCSTGACVAWVLLCSGLCVGLWSLAQRRSRRTHQSRPSENSSDDGADGREWTDVVRLWVRKARVFVLFARVAMLYQSCSLRGRWLARGKLLGLYDPAVLHVWARTHERAGALLDRDFSRLGGLWVKFAQVTPLESIEPRHQGPASLASCATDRLAAPPCCAHCGLRSMLLAIPARCRRPSSRA